MAARQTGRSGEVMSSPSLIRTICFDAWVAFKSIDHPITIRR